LSENTQNMASLIMLTTVNHSKEKCSFLDNTDIRKKLSNCVRSSNYLVFVTAKVLLSPHEKQEDAIKFLIHWLKEAMSNQQYMTKHGLSAKLILYCLYLLSNNSSNKRMIEENAYVTTLHQHIHLETDPSIALNYILLLKKLEEEEEKEELPAIMSFEKHEPFRENVTLKDISPSNTLEVRKDDKLPAIVDLKEYDSIWGDAILKEPDGTCNNLQVRKEVEETLPTNVSFGKYELSKENVKLSIPISTNNALQVWKGRMNAGVDVAVKMNSGSMPQNEFLIEAKILSKMQNEHIIQFLGVVLDQTSYIVTEFIPNGTLLNVLKTDYANLIQLYDILVMNVEVCEGMNYLESHKIVHRDLRAENIFVGYNFKVYIAGFGNATAIDNENHQISRKDYSYKIKWAAPEAARNKQFSSKSDVWSFGILMYETVTFGCEPYDKKSDSDVIQMIQDGGCLSKPQNERFEIPGAFYDIMKSCWRLLPEDRPTFENLLNNFVKYV
ncbi:tyrosine-protein kinase FRK, partial [Biomphalaria glabrata]